MKYITYNRCLAKSKCGSISQDKLHKGANKPKLVLVSIIINIKDSSGD